MSTIPEHPVPAHFSRSRRWRKRHVVHALMALMLAHLQAAECIAHRGDSIRHPDNTLQAVAAAWRCGADVVELDVRMTGDGVLVLFHDAEVHDAERRKHPLSGMTHEALDAAVPAHRVPTLHECLKAGEAGQRYLLDLKDRSQPFLRKVIETVESSTVSGCEVILQSTSLEALDYLRQHARKGTRLFHVTDLKPPPGMPLVAAQLALRLQQRGLQGITAKGRAFVDRDFVAAFHGKGLKFYVWTINPPERIRHYADLGVDGIITDDPVAFRKVVPRKLEQPRKKLPLPGELLVVEGRTAFLMRPEHPSEGPVPWVWYAPTLPNLPGKQEEWMFRQWLDKGIAIAGIDVGESYGSPQGRRLYQAFYQELTGKRGMAKKPCLLARSRGGLMLYNWAVEHPQSVSGIAGIYPVCNLTSYPGLHKASGAYEMTAADLEKALQQHNPVSRLKPLAEAKVPVLHLQGNADKVVPLDANSGMLKEGYERLGGAMTLELIEGGGHDLKAHWFTSQKLVDFVSFHATGGRAIHQDKALRERMLRYLDEDGRWELE